MLLALAIPGAAPSPDEAIGRQRAEVRDAVEGSPCRPGADPEEILVCGRMTGSPPTAPVTGYDPAREFSAPARGPWFELRRGPLSIACCAIDGSRGTGAGLSLRLRF
jgi:hypothetical protein